MNIVIMLLNKKHPCTSGGMLRAWPATDSYKHGYHSVSYAEMQCISCTYFFNHHWHFTVFAFSEDHSSYRCLFGYIQGAKAQLRQPVGSELLSLPPTSSMIIYLFVDTCACNELMTTYALGTILFLNVKIGLFFLSTPMYRQCKLAIRDLQI